MRGRVKHGWESPAPHPGGLALSSTRAALAQDRTGGCLQPTSLQRNRPGYSAGETPPLFLSVLPKGVTVGFPAGLVLPKHSRAHPSEPRKAPGAEGAGLELGDAGGWTSPSSQGRGGGSSGSCPWRRSRAGPAAAAGRSGLSHPPPRHLSAPRQERTGAPASSAPLHRSGWVGNAVRRREHDVLINN